VRHGGAERVSLFRARDDESARLASYAAFKGAGVNAADQVDLGAVHRVDAAFDADLFLAGATSLFLDVRAALTAGSIDPVSGRLSPQMTASLGNQLHYAVESGHELGMSSIDTVTAVLRGVEALSTGDLTCLVRLNVTGRMGPVSLISDVPPPVQLAALPTRTWYETWRLSRPAGGASPPLPTACPSCGAPASGETHCHYCHSLLVDATTGFRVQSIECMG
jgi:hypothetical protein